MALHVAWRMFHVHMRRICILLLWVVMLYKSQLSPSGLMCHLKCVFLLIFCLDDLSVDENGVLKVPHYYCVTVDFSLYGC